MDKKLLDGLLHRQKEEDWFDFKSKLKLFYADGNRNDDLRDELIKDILGMANGNSHIIRKTKYLIIGVDDKKFDENGMRILYDVNYQIPTYNDINAWMKSACEPPVTGIECETVLINGTKLFVITIPPTFDLHETRRELITPKQYNEHTVFMRQGDNTVSASVKEGVTIQQLKHLHRQEVANPSAIWLGAVIGGLVSAVFWDVGGEVSANNAAPSNFIVRIVAFVFGAFFGGEIGWVIQIWNQTRYDWRYMEIKERIGLAIFIIILVSILYIWLFK